MYSNNICENNETLITILHVHVYFIKYLKQMLHSTSKLFSFLWARKTIQGNVLQFPHEGDVGKTILILI